MGTPKGTVPWNAGTGKGWTDKRGYRWIYLTENGRRRAKREHRHIMEQHIGRKLRPEEIVHHVNGITSDNRIENLELREWSEHTIEHHNGSRHREYSKHTQSVIAEYREENKRLCALSADLLAGLKFAADHIEATAHLLTEEAADEEATFVVRQARAAIAKAEGE